MGRVKTARLLPSPGDLARVKGDFFCCCCKNFTAFRSVLDLPFWCQLCEGEGRESSRTLPSFKQPLTISPPFWEILLYSGLLCQQVCSQHISTFVFLVVIFSEKPKSANLGCWRLQGVRVALCQGGQRVSLAVASTSQHGVRGAVGGGCQRGTMG